MSRFRFPFLSPPKRKAQAKGSSLIQRSDGSHSSSPEAKLAFRKTIPLRGQKPISPLAKAIAAKAQTPPVGPIGRNSPQSHNPNVSPSNTAGPSIEPNKRMRRFRVKKGSAPPPGAIPLGRIVKRNAKKPSSAQALRMKKQRALYQAQIKSRRHEKRKKVFLFRLRILSKMAFFAAIAYGLVWLWSAPFWIFDAKAPGAIAISSPQPETLLDAKVFKPWLEAESGQALFYIQPDELRQQIMNIFPILEDVQISRSLFPAKLSLRWIEHEPWGVLLQSPTQARPDRIITNRYVPISTHGFLFSNQALSGETIPRIIIPTRRRLTTEEWKTIDGLVQRLQSIDGLHLTGLNLTRPNDVMVYFKDAAFKDITVRLGHLDATLDERLKPLAYLTADITSMRTPLEYLDLRWENQVVFKKPGPKDTASLDSTVNTSKELLP